MSENKRIVYYSVQVHAASDPDLWIDFGRMRGLDYPDEAAARRRYAEELASGNRARIIRRTTEILAEGRPL